MYRLFVLHEAVACSGVETKKCDCGFSGEGSARKSSCQIRFVMTWSSGSYAALGMWNTLCTSFVFARNFHSALHDCIVIFPDAWEHDFPGADHRRV